MVPWCDSSESLDVSEYVIVLVDLITESLFSGDLELLSSEVTGDVRDVVVVMRDDEKEPFCIPSSSNELGMLPQEKV